MLSAMLLLINGEIYGTDGHNVNARINVLTRNEKDVVLFEARDRKAKVAVHKSYVKKQK